VYSKTPEAEKANTASHKAKWQIYFVIHATTEFTKLDGKRFEMYGLRMKLNCRAKRHHYSMFNVGRSVFDVHFFSVNLPQSPGVNIS
jgi:hypothetical protein